MDFAIPNAIHHLTHVVSEFVRKELLPLEADFLNTGIDAVLPRLDEKRATVRRMGLWAPHAPAEAGGQGLSLLEFAHIAEELGRCPLGHYVFNCQAPDAGNMEILHKYGTNEQKQAYLLPLVAGDIRSCFSMTEPAYPGSNPTWLGTTAVKDGDDYVINGDKWFTTAADGAAFSIVMAVTNPEQAETAPARQHDHRSHRHARLHARAQHLDHGRDRQRHYQPRRSAVGRLPRARRATGWAKRAPALPLPRNGSGRDASITACAGSVSASGLSI